MQLYHTNKQKVYGTPVNLQWEKNANNIVPQEIKDGIGAHKNSFNCHAWSRISIEQTQRKNSRRLNVSILYEEYFEQCKKVGMTSRKFIFTAKFLTVNLTFHFMYPRRIDVILVRQWIKMETLLKKRRAWAYRAGGGGRRGRQKNAI
jgi:hypothetical protein